MTNWYSIFYWLTVSDGVKSVFDTTSNIFTWFSVILFICYCVAIIGCACTISSRNLQNKEEEDNDSVLRSWRYFKKYVTIPFYAFTVLAIITWTGYVATPSKKDCLMIIAGGAVGNFITTDSSAKQLPANVMAYLNLNLKDEILKLQTPTESNEKPKTKKDDLLDKAASLSKDELIKYLKNDTTIK
jgi:heme/copper-type cytochrome/quinol oxidase subunit 2